MTLGHKAFVVILIICIAIQLYRPHKNIQKEVTKSDFLWYEKAPRDIRQLYTNACYDCHSNYTNYEWFDNIAPVSWYIDNTIKKGIFSLNFSEWGNFDIVDKEIMFSAIPFNINSDRMPTKEYKIVHPKAKLSDKDKTKILIWLKQVKQRFLKKENE